MKSFYEEMIQRQNFACKLPLLTPPQRANQISRLFHYHAPEITRRCRERAKADLSNPFTFNMAMSHYRNGIATNLNDYSKNRRV